MSFFDVFERYMYDCHEEVSLYYAQHEEEAAELFRKLDYGNGSLPDYDNPYTQKLYHLRYMYAYGYEYREMFRRLLQRQEPDRRIRWNMLSIGCGSGIDYWAFIEAHVNEQAEGRLKGLEYTGADLEDWGMKWGSDYFDHRLVRNRLDAKDTFFNAQHEQCDAVEFLRRNQDVLPYNVIVFPKSISEFSDRSFEEMLNILENANFRFACNNREYDTEKVNILVSLRWKPDVPVEELLDKQRSDRLKEAMERNGFCLHDEAAAEVYSGEDLHIIACDQDFKYPEVPYRFMQELSNMEICKSPITNTKFNCNRIMTFVRG